ncbi:MAG: NadS family protein [Alphaproteobacteria bacterium]
MTSSFGQDLIKSLTEAVAHGQGKPGVGQAHTIDVLDVRAIREQLHMSQQEFSRAYRIPLPTLKGWEQGRRQPDGTASAYLNVIARLPEETRAALAS